MHTCTKCGREFEGKFCPDCGTRFVEKDVCPKCGAHHEPDAKFCQECGARLDGKTVCPRCGALSEGSFCKECGARLTGGAYKAERTGRIDVKAILGICGVFCFALAALMGLIFTFVTGVSVTAENVTETNMLYYYFGDAYKDIDAARNTLMDLFGWRKIGEAREFALYFPVVLGTVASAVGILGAVALSALTVYKAVRKYYYKKDANVVAPAIGVYLCFAAMATLLLSLSAAELGEAKTVFSAPTLAGLITGGVFLGLGILLSAIAHYEMFKGFNSALTGALSLAVGVLAVVAIALAALPALSMGESTSKSAIGLFSGLNGALIVIKEDEIIFNLVAYSAIGGVAVMAIAVISAVVIFRKATALSRGENKGCLVLCAVNVVLAAVYLACTIFFGIDMTQTNVTDASLGYAVPITLVVFTFLACVAEVVRLFVPRHDSTLPVQPEQPETVGE